MSHGEKASLFEERLANYASSVRSTARAMRGGTRNWPMYAAVTGSALAAATSASASIISYNGAPVTVTANGNTQKTTVHLSGMPGFVLQALHSYAGSGSVFGGNGKQAGLLQLMSGANHLNSNSKIGPSGHFTQVAGKLVHGTFGEISEPVSFQGPTPHESDGPWAGLAGEKAFEGFRFSSGNGFEYGWAQLAWSGDENGVPTSLTLYGLAYDNTPGEVIAVGDTGVSESGAPEPGTAGLMLLALGAAGVGVLRRQRVS